MPPKAPPSHLMPYIQQVEQYPRDPVSGLLIKAPPAVALAGYRRTEQVVTIGADGQREERHTTEQHFHASTGPAPDPVPSKPLPRPPAAPADPQGRPVLYVTAPAPPPSKTLQRQYDELEEAAAVPVPVQRPPPGYVTAASPHVSAQAPRVTRPAEHRDAWMEDVLPQPLPYHRVSEWPAVFMRDLAILPAHATAVAPRWDPAPRFDNGQPQELPTVSDKLPLWVENKDGIESRSGFKLWIGDLPPRTTNEDVIHWIQATSAMASENIAQRKDISTSSGAASGACKCFITWNNPNHCWRTHVAISVWWTQIPGPRKWKYVSMRFVEPEGH